MEEIVLATKSDWMFFIQSSVQFNINAPTVRINYIKQQSGSDWSIATIS